MGAKSETLYVELETAVMQWAMRALKTVIPNKSPIDALRQCRIDVGQDSISIYGTDTEYSACLEVPAVCRDRHGNEVDLKEMGMEGAFVEVPFRKLLVINTMNGDNVTLRVGDTSRLGISGGGSDYSVTLGDQDMMPSKPDPNSEGGEDRELPTRLLSRGLSIAACTVGDDASPAFGGIAYRLEGNAGTFISANSGIGSITTVDMKGAQRGKEAVELDNPDMQYIQLPAKTPTLLDLLGSSATMRMIDGAVRVFFTNDRGWVSVRRHDEDSDGTGGRAMKTEKHLRRVIARIDDVCVSIPRKPTLEAMGRMAICTADSTFSIVDIEFEWDEVTIGACSDTCIGKESIQVRESMGIEGSSNEKLTRRVNLGLMIQALESMESGIVDIRLSKIHKDSKSADHNMVIAPQAVGVINHEILVAVIGDDNKDGSK